MKQSGKVPILQRRDRRSESKKFRQAHVRAMPCGAPQEGGPRGMH